MVVNRGAHKCVVCFLRLGAAALALVVSLDCQWISVNLLLKPSVKKYFVSSLFFEGRLYNLKHG